MNEKGAKNRKNSPLGLDELDIKILKELQADCRTPVQLIAQNVKTPASTVHYRLKRLDEQDFITGYYAAINTEKVEKDYLTVMQVRASYGKDYHNEIGNKLADLPGVWAVYFLLGEWDFLVLIRSKDRNEYMKLLEIVMSLPGIERTSSLVVIKTIKEDPRIEL
ncbi:MAG: Lrp/AsnC family transcriptional regulator [Candidatus Hodarchaeales archaeon]|jgi:DNA-binding Lrp family transcriptional regulator